MRLRWGRVTGWLGAALLFVGMLPLIILTLASGLAWFGRCEIEAVDNIPPCDIAGVEISGFLQIAAFAIWLFVLTMPIAVLGAGFVAIAALITLVRWARRRQ